MGKNHGTNLTNILVSTNDEENTELRQNMRHMSKDETIKTQTIRRTTSSTTARVCRRTNHLRLDNGFTQIHRSSNRSHLRSDPYHSRTTKQVHLVRTLESQVGSTRVPESFHGTSISTNRMPKDMDHRQRLESQFQVLENSHRWNRPQSSPIHSISQRNGWT